MREPRDLPYFTAVTVRGDPATLQAFINHSFHHDQGDLMFAAERLLPPPEALGLDGSFHEGRVEMVMVCLADGRTIPLDAPAEGRAAKMLTFLAGFDEDPRAVPVDLWLTMCQATGLPTSSDEAAIATAWLRLNPNDRAIGAARLQKIQQTGYASASCWMVDHWGCGGLTIRPAEFTPASEEEGPSIYFQLIGAGGAPDLLLERIARTVPDLRFEVTAFFGSTIWMIEMQGQAVQKRHPDNEDDAERALKHLGLAVVELIDDEQDEQEPEEADATA